MRGVKLGTMRLSVFDHTPMLSCAKCSSVMSRNQIRRSESFLITSKSMASFPRMIVLTTLVSLLGATAIQSSCAAQRVARHGTRTFDGIWSVVLQTTRGACPAAVRAGVRILGGRLSAEDQNYGVAGRVAPSGAVRVMVSAAGQTGVAFGRLSREAGWGYWRTSSGQCAGQWTAARRD
jgi:hypothetical protein